MFGRRHRSEVRKHGQVLSRTIHQPPNGSGLQLPSISPHSAHSPPIHLVGACFVSTSKGNKKWLPRCYPVEREGGGRSARFCSAGVVCLSTRPSVWNFINILLLFFSLSSCGRCVVFLNLLKAGQIAEKKLAVRGT